MIKLFYMLVLLLISFSSIANIAVTVFLYEEKETGTDAVMVRYLVNDQFMRIDNGNVADDFILFNRSKNIIYSVNQQDRSVLVIKSQKWTQVEYPFTVKEDKKILNDAPTIEGKKVLDYSLTANQEICQRIQIVPDIFNSEMQAFIEYQNVLSGQQADIVNTTPVEMRTPCFLVDQVYNAGDYYLVGLPVQEWHSRGYIKSLRNYKQETVEEGLFVLPGKFRHYSISNQ